MSGNSTFFFDLVSIHLMEKNDTKMSSFTQPLLIDEDGQQYTIHTRAEITKKNDLAIFV